jgi:hypothetical protein
MTVAFQRTLVAQRIKAADALATVVGLDMAEAGWTPTVDNYLGRVTKPRIIEAVREAKGDATAVLIEHLKKGDMAREAERLLEGHGLAARTAATAGHRTGRRGHRGPARFPRLRWRCRTG